MDASEQSATPKEAKRKRKELEKEALKKLKQEQKEIERERRLSTKSDDQNTTPNNNNEESSPSAALPRQQPQQPKPPQLQDEQQVNQNIDMAYHSTINITPNEEIRKPIENLDFSMNNNNNNTSKDDSFNTSSTNMPSSSSSSSSSATTHHNPTSHLLTPQISSLNDLFSSNSNNSSVPLPNPGPLATFSISTSSSSIPASSNSSSNTSSSPYSSSNIIQPPSYPYYQSNHHHHHQHQSPTSVAHGMINPQAIFNTMSSQMLSQNQSPSNISPFIPQQQVQQQQQPQQQTSSSSSSSSLTLTREQMLQAQEMFSQSNKLTRPEKALILGFIAGSRENPRPDQGPIVSLKLNEIEEVLTNQATGQQHRVISELYFQMNYDTGEYKKVKKIRPAL